MKKQLCCIIAAILTGGLIMTACDTEKTPSESSNTVTHESEAPTESKNLFENCPVFYDGGTAVSGDSTLTALTDGDASTSVRLKTALKNSNGENKTLKFTDWSGNVREEAIDNSAVDFYIDLGFISRIDILKLVFDEYSGKSIKVFYSTDGYNFSYYLGEFDGYNAESGEWVAEIGGIYAKSLLFVIPSDAGESIVINSAEAYGSRSGERVLLSGNASYTWNGTANEIFPDDGKKLTDGVHAYGSDTSPLVGKSSTEKDELTGGSGSVITLDLGKLCNVSEVEFSAFITDSGTGTAPDRIDVRYSTDGSSWYDLGQSYIRTFASARGSSRKYLVTRNHTVEAQYIKVYTYCTGMLLCDEISVYGSENSVPEPDYGYPTRPQYFESNTNAASYCNAKLNGKDAPELTDNIHSVGIASNNGANTAEIQLVNPANIAGAVIITNGKISDFSYTIDDVSCGKCDSFEMTAAGEYVYYLIPQSVSKALRKVNLSFNAGMSVNVREVILYAAAPQLPYVRGGFFQLPTSGGIGDVAKNSDYSWYLQLKGMRDMGMEYVVIQYSTHYNAKTTLINGKRITAAGYTYTPTYGSADVCKAVLDSAQKLGMKVWLGTIHDSDFTNPIGNMESYKKIVEDSIAIIDDIYELYGNHPAFGGYYLSDETCDQWLNMSGGVEAARYVYKGQSDRIRELSPDTKIMIAPAIWRSGDPVTGADNLYRIIAPAKKGQRPVVDIVAAQDCLGREASLEVSDSAYNSYMTYVEEWAKAVRRAGAEFWHDAEVFEITNTQKRQSDLLKTLALEAPLSGSIIVFDIPHYFSIFPMGSFNNEYDYFKRLKMREYAEYYSTVRAMVDNTFDAVNESVNEDDGKTVEEPDTTLITPPKKDEVYNSGILINSSPTESMKWHEFTTGNGSSKPEYSLCFDNEALYVLIKTNDATNDYGKGEWWEGKNDLIQIWISGDGETVGDVPTSPYGIRYYINRTGDTTFSSGGENGNKATFSGFTFIYKDGAFTVKIPWKSIGRTVPKKGDGTAIGINIQYIDGSDASWATSKGNSGRDITENELYSF